MSAPTTSAPRDDAEASKLVTFGKYLLLDKIATGGMAEVWLGKTVQDDGVSDLLAIKRLLPRFSDDEEFLHMFVDEARIAGQLEHPGIVQIHELGKVGSSLYIAMEFVWGRDLLGILRRVRELSLPMEPTTIAYIGARMCEALHFAHTATGKDGKPLNVVHRDVSPQNVLVSFDGKVKLIDFGIAKAASRSTKTQAGTLKGKVGYMSPEQVRGAPMDARSDQFAAGTCLYEMLTGRPLFSRANNFEAMELVREAEVPPLEEAAPGTPAKLVEIVMRSLSKRADDRYASAHEMQKALTLFLAEAAPGYERFTLTTWLRGIFRDEMAEEKARLDVLDLIGRRPSVQPEAKRKRTNSSTRLEIGAHDLFDDDEDAETQIFEGSPLAKLEIEVRPVGPYEVFFQRDGAEDPKPSSGSHVRPLKATFRPGRTQAAESWRPPRTDLAELGPYRKPKEREAGRDTDPSPASTAEKGPATSPPPGSESEPSVMVADELRTTMRDPDSHEKALSTIPIDPEHLSLDPAEINSQVIRALLPTGKTDPAHKKAQQAASREPTGPHRASDGRRDPTTRRRIIAEGGAPRRRRSDVIFFAIAAFFMLIVGAGATYWWLAGAATSSIEVRTAPVTSGAVLIDGVSRGRVPLRVEGLSPGRHTVTIVADGYEPTVREVQLAPRASAILELPMQRASGAAATE
ncbi:serine/threonine-protein kinase [Sandaracinus amylolyticus]|uniref:serine/threonine-protein kinase n=1 Tax=Sandaracinus amylolyticus TaxID=927083 RepID=UPI001F440F85|nr:serine/threonine-protein kinase [Sandaracinus amylolyticus]UJR86556.1 Hypothetical protein I5071_86570 [Sandaracinus amylolyticus]